MTTPLESFIARARASYARRHDNLAPLFAFTLVNRDEVLRGQVHAVGEDGILVFLPGRGMYRFRYDQLNWFPPQEENDGVQG
jgi:hypothetical protein